MLEGLRNVRFTSESGHWFSAANFRAGDDPAGVTIGEGTDYRDGGSEHEANLRSARRYAVRRLARDDCNLIATVRHSISGCSSNGLLRKPIAPLSSA